MAKAETQAPDLAELFRTLARQVYKEKGQFRTIENLGIRPLAFEVRKTGQHYDSARFVECYYDVAPHGLPQVEEVLRKSHHVVRFFHLKATGPLHRFKKEKTERLKRFSRHQSHINKVDPAALE